MFKFRKSIKIAKGVRVNIGKKGISSLSLGGKGVTFNAGKKGLKATTSIPGTGLSYSENIISNKSASKSKSSSERTQSNGKRDVSFLLGLGILVMPYLFSWLLLRSGHSKTSRYLGFVWLGIFALSILTNEKP